MATLSQTEFLDLGVRVCGVPHDLGLVPLCDIHTPAKNPTSVCLVTKLGQSIVMDRYRILAEKRNRKEKTEAFLLTPEVDGYLFFLRPTETNGTTTREKIAEALSKNLSTLSFTQDPSGMTLEFPPLNGQRLCAVPMSALSSAVIAVWSKSTRCYEVLYAGNLQYRESKITHRKIAEYLMLTIDQERVICTYINPETSRFVKFDKITTNELPSATTVYWRPDVASSLDEESPKAQPRDTQDNTTKLPESNAGACDDSEEWRQTLQSATHHPKLHPALATVLRYADTSMRVELLRAILFTYGAHPDLVPEGWIDEPQARFFGALTQEQLRMALEVALANSIDS